MNKKMMIASLVLCAGAPVMAQTADVDPSFEGVQRMRASSPEVLGDPVAGPYLVDMGNAAELGQLGVDHAWCHYWISARGNWAGGRVGNWVAKYTEDGTFVKDYDQGSASAWGYRDGASDEANNELYFGSDGGAFYTHTYDPGTGDIGPAAAVNVSGAVGGNTVRALSRMPNGHFLSASFGSSSYEFDLAGTNYNTWGSNGSVYGVAYDAANDTYWWSDAANYLLETSNAMVLTGREVDTFAGFTGPSAQGGLDIYVDARSRSGDAFVQLYQGTPDEISMFEADAGAGKFNSNGTCEGGGCPCACNFDTSTGPDVCDIFDFLAFQNAFVGGESCACNIDTTTGPDVCDIFDFLAFQDEFVGGCP